jgi:ParB/Sulfiredoxin domain
MSKYKIHPAAAIFPMLSDDELQGMAESIQEVGQNEPITLGKWIEEDSGEEVVGIIDGINRERACEIAGVEPKYEMYDGDIKAYINASNLNRRHLTKGQQAMAYAMLYPELKKGGRGKKLLSGLTVSASERVMISRARKVLRHSREMAERIMAGTIFLDGAIETVDREQAQSKKNEALKNWVKENAPELYDDFQDNRITLEEAKEEAERRIKAAKEEEERTKELEEARKQALKDQYERGFEGLKKSLESIGILSDGIFRDIPEWLDDSQTTYNPDDAYEAFNKFFPRGYQEFQAMVNLLEATTRGISKIRQALAIYERSRRPVPEVVQPFKPGPRSI